MIVNADKIGTKSEPLFVEGPTETVGDIHLRQRFFIYRAPGGLVAGKTLTMTYVLDFPTRRVWPYLKDLNLWQNEYGHYYSGVVGDLEGKSFRLQNSPDDDGPHQYRVVRVIPENMIVISQPITAEDEAGGHSPDTHVFLMYEKDGHTVVTSMMEHAALTRGKTVDEALAPWIAMADESHKKFRDIIIAKLKSLVAEDPLGVGSGGL